MVSAVRVAAGKAGPFMPRRVDAAALASSRLRHRYTCTCPLHDGAPDRDDDRADTTLALRLSLIGHRTGHRTDHFIGHFIGHPLPPVADALAVTTRFGALVWLDPVPFLIAFTGIDVARATSAAAREAFVHHALGALPAGIHEALGGPVAHREPPCAPSDEWLTASLTGSVRGIRVAMRLAADPQTFLAMVDDGPWQPETAGTPPWLGRLPSGCRVLAATIALPVAQYRALHRGAIVIAPDPRFDTAGRGRITLFGRRLLVSWRDDHHCFEVQHMSDDASPPLSDHRAEASAVTSGDLPVHLAFSLGTLTLPLGEVASIGPGTLLRLDNGLPPSVRIEANGVPLGYGELVDFDGRLAVEITQWPDRDQRAVPA
ncbi:type III secretion system apparatus protein YscQ/HrcQ [Trinickia caryophylli]|uniref:Type III secretion system apparatus protein YscQ/HrcQ n=2 Tax=Trinickia caryophylli TaxID=28094 RepID=A0A1X7DZ45_TRICW|nr:type III secretion system apparatus protein YscQ/HrcQ [Trinickia caryophylli]